MKCLHTKILFWLQEVFVHHVVSVGSLTSYCYKGKCSGTEFYVSFVVKIILTGEVYTKENAELDGLNTVMKNKPLSQECIFAPS